MRRSGRRGPTQLRFRALLSDVEEAIEQVRDARQPGKTQYSLHDCYASAYAMFFLQDPSLVEFQCRFEDELRQRNPRTIFDVTPIPSDTRFGEIIDERESTSLNDVYRRWFYRLQRLKYLERYRFLGGRYLLTLDGGGSFNSKSVHQKRIPTRPEVMRRSRPTRRPILGPTKWSRPHVVMRLRSTNRSLVLGAEQTAAHDRPTEKDVGIQHSHVPKVSTSLLMSVNRSRSSERNYDQSHRFAPRRTRSRAQVQPGWELSPSSSTHL